MRRVSASAYLGMDKKDKHSSGGSFVFMRADLPSVMASYSMRTHCRFCCVVHVVSHYDDNDCLFGRSKVASLVVC